MSVAKKIKIKKIHFLMLMKKTITSRIRVDSHEKKKVIYATV